MLGKVRASPVSSLELLEMERPPSKVVKHDSLSIYESTLLKLKQGSRCNPSCNQEDSDKMDTSCAIDDSPEEAMMSNADCCSHDLSLNPTPNFQSPGSSKNQTSKNKSIIYFLSKYNSLHQVQIRETMMAVEGHDYSSPDSLPASSS